MKSSNPLVTVLMPVYNGERYLTEAIESVLNQTFTDFEILVMDDGSTDNTKEVIKEFNDERIIYHYDSNSGGPARPRNKGISFAKGGVIAFLDSDDYWHPEKLQKQIEQTKIRRGFPIHFTDEIWIRNGIRVNPKKKHQKREAGFFSQVLHFV